MAIIKQKLNELDIQILKEGMFKAGDIAMDFWQKGVKTEVKTANYDITTEADRAVEAYLISLIRKSFPNFGIVGEESGGKVSDNVFTIDGIDGSTFFAAGLKEWTITLAQLQGEKVIIGIVYSPALNEFYFAKRGLGAYLNGERIYVSKIDEFQYSIINLGQDVIRIYNRFNIEQGFIKASCAHFVIASSSLAYGRLAAGKIQAALHMGQPIWDIAPGIVLVEEAGGRFTNWNNTRKFSFARERINNVIASNGILHEQAIRLINQQ